MPPGIFVTAHLFPAMLFRTLVLGTFLKGLGLRVLWVEAAYFLFYGAAAFGLCMALFRKRTRA